MNAATDTNTTTTDTTTAQSSGSTTDTTASTAAPQTTGTTRTGSETTTTTQEPAPWQDSLPDALKVDPLFRGYKDVGELAKAHRHLTDLKGVPANELLRIPAKTRDQDPEAWTAFDAARGVPSDPKEYKIELAPEAAADTPELAEILRDLGGKAKFDNHQMAAVTATLNELGQKAAENEAKALDAETTATTAALKKEWGAAYDGNTRGIGKLIRDALGGEIDEAAAADLQDKIGSNLTVSRVLAYALGKMGEPETPEGGGLNGGGGKPLTPAAATAALNAFYADKGKMEALNNGGHPQHKAVMEERRQLLAQQSAGNRPDQPRP